MRGESLDAHGQNLAFSNGDSRCRQLATILVAWVTFYGGLPSRITTPGSDFRADNLSLLATKCVPLIVELQGPRAVLPYQAIGDRPGAYAGHGG
jgi:hypothetical protein